MPCNCDHLEPSAQERESSRVCQLLVKFMDSPPPWVISAAESPYGYIWKANEATRMLCELCAELDDSVIYDGKNPDARKLADWWDAHKIADAKRKEREATEVQRKIDAAAGLAKLTPAERKALGL